MNRLAYFLRRTGAKVVHLDVDQVAELVGEQHATNLALYVNDTGEIRTQVFSSRSSIPKEKRVRHTRMGGYNRLELLKAIGDSSPEKPEGNPEPNPQLLSNSKVQELKNKGYYTGGVRTESE